jgi:hypothetical protein
VFASARTGGHRSAKRKACSSEKANKDKKVHGRQNFVKFCKNKNIRKIKIKRGNLEVDKQEQKQKTGKQY